MIKQSPALKNAVNFFLACGVSRRRILATVLISLFCTPATFGTLTSRQLGQAPTRISAPITAPPEPYLIGNTTSITVLAASVFKAASSALAYMKSTTTPEGLGAARMPTFGERVLGLARPFVALVKPSASSVATSTPPQPSSVVDFDFDNDGKADIGRWHGANTELKVRNSNGGSYSTFTVGTSSAVIAPGDFNGDGKTDAATFNAGTWKYKTSTSGSEQTISWGTSGDVPVAGDYDADGITDAAIYRPSTNTWWILKSTGGNTSTALGSAGDIPVPGDYDGDGKNDVVVYRPSSGYWYINGSLAGSYALSWGIAIDTPVPADYDGDGKTTSPCSGLRPGYGTRVEALMDQPCSRRGATGPINRCREIMTATTRRTSRCGGRRPGSGTR